MPSSCDLFFTQESYFAYEFLKIKISDFTGQNIQNQNGTLTVSIFEFLKFIVMKICVVR